MTSLAQIAIGQRVRVLAVEGSDDLTQRLLEMGLTPGIEVTLIGTALWGDPLEFEVRGYRLSLRKDEARRVHVEALA